MQLHKDFEQEQDQIKTQSKAQVHTHTASESFGMAPGKSLNSGQSCNSGMLFTPYQNSGAKMQAFSALLEKRPDGKCHFLTASNRCELHERFGPEAKPAMCRLFPFTFMETPDEVRASVSFASTAVLLNYGDLLSEQMPLLVEQYDLFKTLFPGLTATWDNLQLVDGLSMSWAEFRRSYDPLVLWAQLQPQIAPSSSQIYSGISERLPDLCQKLYAAIPEPIVNKLKTPKLPSSLKIQDQLLLKYFHALYGTVDGLPGLQQDIDSKMLTTEIINAPNTVEIEFSTKPMRVSQLLDLHLKEAAPEFVDLIDRFVYNRLFSLLYFGYGFANLSLLAGLGHLGLLAGLLRLAAKAKLLTSVTTPEFLELASLVRLAESKLTHASYSAATCSIVEVLLTDWQRISRITALGN